MKNLESYNPSITRHFAYARQAYNTAQAFGLGILSTINNQLYDYGIKITENQAHDLIQELYRKDCEEMRRA